MRDGYYVREYGILLKLKLNQMTRCSIDQVIVLMELLYTIDNACSEKCYRIFMFYKQHLLPDDYVIAFETRELHPGGAGSEVWNLVYMIAPVKKFGRVRLSTNFP